MGTAIFLTLMVSVVFSAYHHEGESDSDKFLATYPDKAGTKLDHCALCHSGGSYQSSSGSTVSLGSCQWCHYSYGYDGGGNIVDTLNEYGMDYLVNGRNEAGIQAIGNTDSDGDGYSNLTEIQAKRFPGDANDDPSKVVAPYRVYTKAQLEAISQHTQFLLMNTSRSGDFYAEYTGVTMEDLLQDAGILDSATGIKVYAPDGWSDYHPLEQDPDPELYHVFGTYLSSVYYYDTQADVALNSVDGWCDYSAPSCQGRNHLEPIVIPDGLKMILAIKRESAYMDPGVLNEDNKLDGEGPFRVVPPQKTPSPPDQSSRATNQAVTWPYNFDWDHNAGSSTRTVTIIKVEPLSPGTTDIDTMEAGWNFVDQEKLVIYGAIDSRAPLNIGNLETNLTGSPVTGQNIQLTFSANGGGNTLYYQFWKARGYQTQNYGNWQLLNDWSMDNTLAWTPDADGHYVIVAYVSADTTNNIYHQAGLSIETQGNSSDPIQITSLTSNMNYPQSRCSGITLHTTATGGSGPLYYKYWYQKGVGGAWYAIRDYTTQSSCTWTPAEDGFYTVVVWVTDDLSVAEPSIAGMNVAIGN